MFRIQCRALRWSDIVNSLWILMNLYYLFFSVGKFVHSQWPSHSLFSPACFRIVMGIILSAAITLESCESIKGTDTSVFNYHANYMLWANEWSVYCLEKAETKSISHSEALYGPDIIDQFKWKPHKNVFMRKWLNDFQDTFPWSRAHDHNHSVMAQTEWRRSKKVNTRSRDEMSDNNNNNRSTARPSYREPPYTNNAPQYSAQY